MVLTLRAIFGAAVVGDFLLAIALLAFWNLYRRMSGPPPLPEELATENADDAQEEESVC